MLPRNDLQAFSSGVTGTSTTGSNQHHRIKFLHLSKRFGINFAIDFSLRTVGGATGDDLKIIQSNDVSGSDGGMLYAHARSFVHAPVAALMSGICGSREYEMPCSIASAFIHTAH